MNINSKTLHETVLMKLHAFQITSKNYPVVLFNVLNKALLINIPKICDVVRNCSMGVYRVNTFMQHKYDVF